MLRNPDIAPSAASNRWITYILNFHFRLVHVPGSKHGPDGPSRRPPQLGDTPRLDDDDNEFGDQNLSFVHLANPFPRSAVPSRLVASFAHGTSNESASELTYDQVPRSMTAQRIDNRITLLNTFFDTLERPPDMSDKEFTAFTKFATAFFPQDGRLWRKHSNGAHRLVVSPDGRIRILRDCHDGVAHRGVFATKSLIAEQFWWPDIAADVAWYIRTCHLCQTRRHQHILIPPMVASPTPLFARVYMDTMHLPPSQRYKYLVRARCSLSTFPEWAALQRETGRAIGEWIYANLLCRWGALLEIVTDNGTPFIKALDYLATKYKVHHIRISGYNSRANSIVERAHYDVRQALYKAADGDENRWYAVAHSVFWSERVTVRKRMGCSPYFAVTGTHPVLPLDIAEATYLIQPPDRPLSTTELMANRAIALQRHQDQLEKLHSRVPLSSSRGIMAARTFYASSTVQSWIDRSQRSVLCLTSQEPDYPSLTTSKTSHRNGYKRFAKTTLKAMTTTATSPIAAYISPKTTLTRSTVAVTSPRKTNTLLFAWTLSLTLLFFVFLDSLFSVIALSAENDSL